MAPMPETPSPRLPERDRPWMMRTYAGHSDAKRSNELYRRNLEKGQTGLSVAFDLPTQTGYDPDHELARGEVGKVGVSIAHAGDMRTLLDGIPLDQMNTSMTINATAAWLLALYIVAAEEQASPQDQLQGTTQNDILKEYLSRGTYAFPPGPSMRLIADTIAYTVAARPEVEPDQHLLLPPAGGRRDAGAGDRLRDEQRDRRARRRPRARRPRTLMGERVRADLVLRQRRRAVRRGARQAARDGAAVGRARAASATASSDEKHRRFRYGVQVNSLGLTEAQPENNVYRIALEALAVTLGRSARARAIQLPGLERGARAAAAVGSAVVAAPAADPRLRDRPARVPGHLRGLEGDGGPRRRAGRGRPRGDGATSPSSAARSRRSTT